MGKPKCTRATRIANLLWHRVLLVVRLLGGFCFAVLAEYLDLDGFSGNKQRGGQCTNIELPTLHVFARLLARDDDYQLGDFAAVHPLFELRHDLLDVGLDLIVGRDHHCQAIFLDARAMLASPR